MGGTGLYVDALASALAGLGHELAIVFPSADHQTSHHESNGMTIQSLMTSRPKRWRDTWDGPIEPWSRWLGQWKPDVVHFHHLSGFPLGLVEHTSCRTVLTLHDYAIPCARGQLVTDDLKTCDGPSEIRCTQCMGAALNGHPILAAAGKVLARFPGMYRWGKRRLQPTHVRPHVDIKDRMLAARRCLTSADVLLSPSQDLIDRMASMDLPKPQRSALPLVQPIEPFPPAEPGPVRFLFASSIIPTKGPDRLFRAFCKLDGEPILSIAGHAPYFPSHPTFAANLKSKVDRHPRANWLGHIKPSQVPQIMANHDVLVLPSVWPENSPLVVREATAGGLSVIVSASGGSRELTEHAALIHTEDDLTRAMQVAVANGRIRQTPTRWLNPTQHAKVLLDTAYRD
jgi:glycosyltransferase involved in cell wall biosynthesis